MIGIPLLAMAAAASAPIRPAHLLEVPFTQVRIEDRFWAPKQEVNRRVSIEHSLDMLDKFGYMTNFDLAAAHKTEGFQGLVFMDSDVYKCLEAASYSLATHPDPILEKRLDGIIARMAAAQQPDGYLNTWFQVKAPGKRWTNLRDWHELYCAGHLFEAAAAHFQATGKRNLLDIATKYADHIDAVFGPGKRDGYCGHPEIELALVKLWRVTGNAKYRDLASFFIHHRGEHFFAKEHGTPEGQYDGAYWLDDVPITMHDKVKGHAVRAAYLMSGATDIGGLEEDSELLAMVARVWKNTDERNTYITGGIGPSASNEGFTHDFDLPNLTAYQETCASVALAQWNHRLSLLYGDAKYADCVERSLYNGVISGVSLSGDRFFYVNPLASHGDHHRSEWFGCACCPPNETRTLASLGSYAYATSNDTLFVNLYVAGGVTASVGGKKIEWDVATDYPWDGRIRLTARTTGKYGLSLRIPGWCGKWSASVAGRELGAEPVHNGYLRIEREWNAGDTVELNLDMPVRRVVSDPRVVTNRGLTALQRGPIVYCLEAVDQTAPIHDMWLPADTKVSSVWHGDLLGGVATLEGSAMVSDAEWPGGLYAAQANGKATQFRAVPYYAWDNRAAGEMAVWMPTSPPVRPVRGLEGSARVSLSFTSGNCQPWGINDGAEVRNSGEQPAALCHWWPHKGGTEWVQYDWSIARRIGAVEVYWFDDTGRGECRFPASWRLLTLKGRDWVPIAVKTGHPIKADQWCRVEFEPIETYALRLEIKMRDGWAAGIHEWKVEKAD